MAFARLTGAGSVVVAMGLAVLVPNVQGAGVSAVAGWLAVAVLALGVGIGERTAVVIAGVTFIVRVAMLATLAGPVFPPPWVQVLMLVLSLELAAASLEARVRSRPAFVVLGRAGVSGLSAMVVALIMEGAVYGTNVTGILLRIGAVAALVLAVGWVLRLWSKALG